MTNHISVAELQSAVAAAVSKVKFETGPLIIGFVAPDTLSHETAAQISEEVSHAISQLHGTPTVGTFTTAAVTTERARTFGPGHIIIGLVFEER